MKNVIITLVGKDQPGLVETIATCVFNAKGNWQSSNLSKMAGQFAGIIQVQLPETAVPEVEKYLSALPQLNCIVQVDECHTETIDGQYITIDVMGNDKPGIVQEITTSLAQSSTSVVKMQTSCEAAPNWGGNLFKAHIIAAVDATTELDTITEQLEAIANDLVVELNIQQH
jgi:glycine cleavage system regulatory protein